MKRTDIINYIISNKGYKSYLEIGIYDGKNFRSINCSNKVGVDPNPNKNGEKDTTFKVTSDQFFSNNSEKYDIIFIDGLHHSEQVLRDIENSLKALTEYGTIVCHDMNPRNEIIQRVPRETEAWTGDCWKAWVQLRKHRNDLFMAVVDTDYGCGIIQKGFQEIINIEEELTYNNLDKYRKEWLNLISIEEFKLCNWTS